jgi:hypothetical protein
MHATKVVVSEVHFTNASLGRYRKIRFDEPAGMRYHHGDKFALTFLQMGRPEFHAEWLRDEPCDATATGSRSYIPTARCQLPPGNGEHEIRMRASGIPITSFLFPGKEAFEF